MFELKYHVLRVLISIITNHFCFLISIITIHNAKGGKEDPENAISNDLETLQTDFKKIFKLISLLCASHGSASWESGQLSLTSFLLPEWPSCGIYMNIPCKYLTDQIRSIKAQCNTVYPKICLENAHISVLGVEKYKKFAFSLEGGQNPTPNPPPSP